MAERALSPGLQQLAQYSDSSALKSARDEPAPDDDEQTSPPSDAEPAAPAEPVAPLTRLTSQLAEALADEAPAGHLKEVGRLCKSSLGLYGVWLFR